MNYKIDKSNAAALAYSNKPKFIAGVTGTDGKTSIAWKTYMLWKYSGKKCAYMGTLGLYNNCNVKIESYKLKNMTTFDSFVIHEILHKLAEAKVQYVVIEASSIGLHQKRLLNVKFDVAVWSTFSSEHLDYHHTIENYRNAKLKILQHLKSQAPFFFHYKLDDKCKREIYKYKYSQEYGKKCYIENNILTWRNSKHMINLQNSISFYQNNLLAALHICETSKIQIKDLIPHLNINVPGRMQTVTLHNKLFMIDYAHTPQAIKSLLSQIKAKYKKIAVITGCGGHRYTAKQYRSEFINKRQKIGKVLQKYADISIITDDNVRTESASQIRSDILSQCTGIEIPSRACAIYYALHLNVNIVLIIGKGDERNQIYGNTLNTFHDLSVLQSLAKFYKM